jgi:hypothetical protein
MKGWLINLWLIPMFCFGVYLSILWGFGLMWGMFVGAGIAGIPMFAYLVWSDKKKS